MSCSRNGNRTSACVTKTRWVCSAASGRVRRHCWEPVWSGFRTQPPPSSWDPPLDFDAFLSCCFAVWWRWNCHDITTVPSMYSKQQVLLCKSPSCFRTKQGGNKPKIMFWWVKRDDELLSETSLPFYILFLFDDILERRDLQFRFLRWSDLKSFPWFFQLFLAPLWPRLSSVFFLSFFPKGAHLSFTTTV